MRNNCLAVYGFSGFGREVMPLVRSQTGKDANVFFVDDGVFEDSAPVLSFDAFAAMPQDDKAVVIAIADSAIRRKIAERCGQYGIGFVDTRAANSIVMDNVLMGEGSILCNFTHITSDVRIGKHFHCNIYSYVAHDCVIGDFVTFAPNVMCNGNVHIEDDAYIGTGAVLKQGKPGAPLRIGRGAVIGMGAVVTRDVPAGATVVGNPARALVR